MEADEGGGWKRVVNRRGRITPCWKQDAWPRGVIWIIVGAAPSAALGKAGARVGFICDASITMRLITCWMRRDREGEQFDLPGLVRRGYRLLRAADGHVATIKSGKLTYREGLPAGAEPSRLIPSNATQCT